MRFGELILRRCVACTGNFRSHPFTLKHSRRQRLLYARMIKIAFGYTTTTYSRIRNSLGQRYMSELPVYSVWIWLHSVLAWKLRNTGTPFNRMLTLLKAW